MFDSTTPDHTCQLPADAYWHLVRTLRLTLPPPLTDDPEDLPRRDRAAIARVAALAPGNAAEADLAAQFVAASEQWKDCLRLAQLPETTPAWAMKCRAQAMGMMRQANSALRLLLRMQGVRRKLEADDAVRDRLAWTEHCALGLMAEALAAPPTAERRAQSETAGCKSSPPPLGAEGEGEVGETAPLLARTNPSPFPLPQGEGEQIPVAEPEPDLLAAAERYAATYPERAARIRRTGKLPSDVRYFDPPEAALARALIAGQTRR
jgi:hypothetical protein